MKKLGVILFSIALIGVLAGTVAAKPKWIDTLTLQYSADGDPMTPVEGELSPGFMLYYNEDVEWYYLDVDDIDPLPDADTLYPFYLKTAPVGPLFEYMASRGVTADTAAGTWEAQMWLIINGEAPMFYLKVEQEDTKLIDGLLYAVTGAETMIRINGDYCVGTYHFIGYPELDGQPMRTMIKLFFA